jgi:transcriptional regulator with XRE-family HTH domain
MTEDSKMPWELPGYGDIVSTERVGDELAIAFANEDVVHVHPSQLGIPWHEFTVQMDPDEGFTVQFGSTESEIRSVDWVQIRAATDPRFAQEMRRRDADQSRRLGLRLRALREDRGLNQRDLASLVGMSSPQLSKIESGTLDLRVSTVQALLRAMDSSFSDIAGPDALEVSQRTLRKRAVQAGVGRDLIERLLASAPRTAVPRLLSTAFGWTPEALMNGVPETPRLELGVRFKTAQANAPTESPIVNLARVASELVKRNAALGPFLGVTDDPRAIRPLASDQNGRVSLDSLLDWTWRRGIAVVPLVGKGAFCAAVWTVDDAPVVVLKEVRESAVFWLFDLAHELGHVALGHVSTEGIVDVDSPQPEASTDPNSDSEEREASRFATQLLLGEPERLLTDIRAETRGNYLRFKNAVAKVAIQHNVSPGLLGMVAAFEMTDIGEPKDRWGSATNLAVDDGSGRAVAVNALATRLRLAEMSELDDQLLRATVIAQVTT